MRLTERDGLTAKAELLGVTRDVSLALCPDARAGDHVLVHVGFVLSRVDEVEAAQTLAMVTQVMAGETVS